MAALDDILEPGPAERLATNFVFTEGPLWHPDGFYYFVDIRRSLLFRLRPGHAPEIVRSAHELGHPCICRRRCRLGPPTLSCSTHGVAP